MRLLNTLVENRIAQVPIASGPLSDTEIICELRRQKYFWLGTYELPVQALLLEYLRPGMIAWDVGAFTGFHTLLLRRLVGRGCTFAIEPDPVNRQLLMQVLAINGFSDVVVSPMAVNDSPGRGRLLRVPDGPSQTQALRSTSGDLAMTSLDALLDTCGRPALIKMDIEGAELLALRGAGTLLRTYRPIWIVELHGDVGPEAASLFDHAGYRVQAIPSWPREVSELVGGASHHILALPR